MAQYQNTHIVRFGNVIRSRGSLLDVAAKQLDILGHVFVTDLRMERYWVTERVACETIVGVATGRTSDYLTVPEMRKVMVVDMLKEHFGNDVPIKLTKPGFGEKLSEELRWPWEV